MTEPVNLEELVSDEEFLAFYNAKLAGQDPAMVDGKPQGGWYRVRTERGGPWHRVEIWRDRGRVVVEINGQAIPESSHGRTWSFCSKHAIKIETFDYHGLYGRWPGEDQPSEAGDNNPPEDLPSQLREKIAAAAKWVESIGGYVTTDEQCDAIANRIDSIWKLRLAADKEREKKKAPALAECREIDEAYNPTIKEASKMEVLLRRLGGDYRTAQRDAERKKQQEQETAAAEARRAEEAARASAPDPARRAEEVSNVVPITPPAPVAPAAPKTYGQIGKKLKEKTVFEATITNLDAVFQFFKQEPELVALLQKYAQRATDSNITVPGVEKVEKVKLA